MRALSVAVIGHVDHGKTALVRALTGKDTDRLEEERARGISIVAGYALLRRPDCEIDLIDVPGHERFLRAMISGAGGVQAVLLAVAANEGVMPQTREHLEIARFLGVRRSVAALTKCDLVDDATRRARIEELRALAAEYELGETRVIATELPAGSGVDALASALESLATTAPAPRDDGFAYLPIDRVFAVPGFGPVATGTLRRGALRVGDELELCPGRAKTRVRSLQIHGRAVTAAPPGRRVAVALRGVELANIRRGMSLAASGRLVESEWLDVEVSAALFAPASLRDGQRLHLLSGAFEAECRLRLLDCAEIAPGRSAIGQIRCAPHVALPACEPFVLRRLSPAATLGGGRTLDPASRRRRRGPPPDSLVAQAKGERKAAILERLREARDAGETIDTLAMFAGTDRTRLESFLLHAGAAHPGSARFYHPDVWAGMLDALRTALDRHHVLHPLEPGLRAARALPGGACIESLAAALIERGEAISENGVLRRPTFAPGAGRSRDVALEIAETLRSKGLSPPDEDELLGADDSRRTALRFLVEQGLVVRARNRVQNRSLFFHHEAVAEARTRLAALFPDQKPFLAGQAGAALGISRKFSIPLLEYLDGIKFTQRRGDQRIVLGCAAPAKDSGGDWGLVAPLVFKTSGSPKTSGGFDSHPPPPKSHACQPARDGPRSPERPPFRRGGRGSS